MKVDGLLTLSGHILGIERIQQNETTLQSFVHGGKKLRGIDGGAFMTKSSAVEIKSGHNVVSDGGSFVRTKLG